MDKLLLLGILCLVMGVGMYLLYLNGWMVLSSKSAVSFVGSKRGTAASFSRCSGSIRRIVRFKESKTYTFTLDSALTSGEMTVSLLGADKKEVLRLSSAQPCMAVELEKNQRYTLILRLSRATGRYGLR
ncbi:MAG: hypothetical protein IJC35_07065, partial [Oscillospiraceae bacterium]|nr:hypothetical protein [Oscillospiraceae bacterium]